MKKNPKVIAGLAGLAVMVILGAVLLIRMIPTIQETRLEMSLTPTPIPAAPEKVWAKEVAAVITPEPPLHNGSQGEKVRDLQRKLQALGYYTGEIDGQFGVGTQEAVISFQKMNGLDADGLAGEETLKMLSSPDAKPYSETQQ